MIVVTHRPKGGAREFEMHCEGSTKRGALAVLALHKALNFFTR